MVLRVFPLLFASSCLWGVTDGTIWEEHFQESNITLTPNTSITVYLNRNPNDSVTRGNNFGYNGGTTLRVASTGNNASLILKAEKNLSDLQFYHKSGNRISVNNNAYLEMNFLNKNVSANRLNIYGGVIEVNNGGSLALKGIYRISVGDQAGGTIKVNQGGRLEISDVTEVRNKRSGHGSEIGIFNYGGELNIKTEKGIFQTNYDLGTSSFNAGSIIQTAGTTTISHNNSSVATQIYNSGFTDLNNVTYGARHALIEVQGGNFIVKGDIKNGGDYNYKAGAGVGWIVGSGGAKIEVSGKIISTSEDSTLPSRIDLYNAALKVNEIDNQKNSEVYLKDKAHIETITFSMSANSKIFFIGSGDGFGSITAQTLALGGDEIFQVELLNKTQDLKYLIATSNNLSGLQLGTITLQNISGTSSNRYEAKLTQNGNEIYLELTPNSTITPPSIPPTPPIPPTPTPTPSSPDYISNLHSISSELDKHFIIPTQETLDSTTQTILSQIEQTQALKSITTYSTSNLYNRTTQAQIIRPAPRLAFNPYTHTQSDFLPTPLLDRSTPYSFFINFIGGAFGYEGSVGGNYGANFGIDGFVSENLFLGGYSVILGKSLESEGAKIQGLQAEIGGYARAILSSWEFDTTLSYTLLHNSTQRAFSLYGQTFSQEASYNTNFFNLEERVGYRFTLTPSDTLKPYAGVGLHLYYQPSYSESGDFTYSQNSLFFGSFALLAGLEYRKVFSSSSLYLGATLGYSIPSFGDTTYSMHFLDSLLVFKNSPIFTAQIQGGAEFAITPTSYLSVELNYKYNDTRYFDVDGILGYRYLF